MSYLPIVLLTAIIGILGTLPEGALGVDAPAGRRTIAGTVTEIKSGMVFVKTAEGTTRNFATDQVRQERIRQLQVGDRVTLELNQDNMIVDLAHFGESQPAHPRISGRLVAFDQLGKTVTLSTEQGQASYGLKEGAALKLASKNLGDHVTLEIDQDNRMAMDVIN